MKATYEVEVKQIEVVPKYFSFYYTIKKDEEFLKNNEEYTGSHSWDELNKLKSLLKEGYAIELALQSLF